MKTWLLDEGSHQTKSREPKPEPQRVPQHRDQDQSASEELKLLIAVWRVRLRGSLVMGYEAADLMHHAGHH